LSFSRSMASRNGGLRDVGDFTAEWPIV